MPLILPSQRIARPNPLAYPAGAVPGIDRSHPAAQGVPVSAIAVNGGNMVSLTQGEPFTAGGATSVTELLGRTIYNQTGQAAVTIATGRVAVTPTAGTFGAIFRPVAIAGDQYIVTFEDTNGNRGMVLSSGTLYSRGTGGTVSASTITLSAGVPYFVALSDPYNASFPINFVVRNLATGQVFTSTNNSSVAPGRTDDFVQIGNEVFNGNPSNSHIAAASYSPNLYLSMAQLLQWANSPWAFWYPNKTINLASSAASAGASFLPVWAYRYNLPVLGTGNF